jgi:DNA-directed RNA polymerase sigma subunit (sigma70/sigma32)
MRFDVSKAENQLRSNPGLLGAIPLTRRNMQILKERTRGKSFAKIGKAYNLSGERIRQICIETLFKIKKEHKP